MIHQHFKLVDVFSAMDNIVLGTKGKRLGRKALREKIEALGQSFGLEIEPEKKVYDMSVSEKQTVEILKVLYRGAQILILDEPTRGIDVGAKFEIYKLMTEVAQAGKAVVMVSSELPELIGMCDRIYVMNQGHIAGELKREEFSQEAIMVYATGTHSIIQE